MLSQDREALLVFDEFLQHSARIKCLVEVSLVLGAKAIEQIFNNHLALLCKHLFHLLLIGSKFSLASLLVAVALAFVADVPGDALFFLSVLRHNFDLKQLDQQQSD